MSEDGPGTTTHGAGDDARLIKKRRRMRQAKLARGRPPGPDQLLDRRGPEGSDQHPLPDAGQAPCRRRRTGEGDPLLHPGEPRLDHPDYANYARPSDDPQVIRAGDATPEYFFWPGALERMSVYNPDMRLAVSLRDPIERAFSQWSMERSRNADFPDVYDAIERFAAPTIPELVPEDVSNVRLRKESLFTRGLYGQQLRRGLTFFPREQWLVLDFRDVYSHPAETLDRMTDLLGIERFVDYPPVLHRNQTPSDHTGRAPPPSRSPDWWRSTPPTCAS